MNYKYENGYRYHAQEDRRKYCSGCFGDCLANIVVCQDYYLPNDEVRLC
jgi:hypothetical protein